MAMNLSNWELQMCTMNPDPIYIREKAFREMKKDVGMTTAQKK